MKSSLIITEFLRGFFPLQSLWDPAPGESRKTPIPVRLLLFLHRHLLNCGLRRRHATDLAVEAAGCPSHLCRPGRSAAAGDPYVLVLPVI